MSDIAIFRVTKVVREYSKVKVDERTTIVMKLKITSKNGHVDEIALFSDDLSLGIIGRKE